MTARTSAGTTTSVRYACRSATCAGGVGAAWQVDHAPGRRSGWPRAGPSASPRGPRPGRRRGPTTGRAGSRQPAARRPGRTGRPGRGPRRGRASADPARPRRPGRGRGHRPSGSPSTSTACSPGRMAASAERRRQRAGPRSAAPAHDADDDPGPDRAAQESVSERRRASPPHRAGTATSAGPDRHRAPPHARVVEVQADQRDLGAAWQPGAGHSASARSAPTRTSGAADQDRRAAPASWRDLELDPGRRGEPEQLVEQPLVGADDQRTRAGRRRTRACGRAARGLVVAAAGTAHSSRGRRASHPQRPLVCAGRRRAPGCGHGADAPGGDMRRPPPGGLAGAVARAGVGGEGRRPRSATAPSRRTVPIGYPRRSLHANTAKHSDRMMCPGITRMAQCLDSLECARGPPPPAARAAAFFDLDKTIIAKSSSLAFGKPFYKGGLINRGAVMRSAYAQFVYLVGGADHDQMERMRGVPAGAVRGLGGRPGPRRSSPRPARPDRPDDLRRGGRADRRAPPGRPRRGHRQHVGHRGGRADRRDARRRPRDRHPDGRRGRPVHRRDRVLRLRPEQGRGDPRAGRARRLRPGGVATPTATPSPTCRCSRRSGTRTRSTRTRRCARRRRTREWPILVFARRWACAAVPPELPHRAGRAGHGRRRARRRRRVVWYAGRRLPPATAADRRPGARPDRPGTHRHRRTGPARLRPPGHAVYDRPTESLPAGSPTRRTCPRNGPLVRVAHPGDDGCDARMVTAPEGDGGASSRGAVRLSTRATVPVWARRPRPVRRSSATAESRSPTRRPTTRRSALRATCALRAACGRSVLVVALLVGGVWYAGRPDLGGVTSRGTGERRSRAVRRPRTRPRWSRAWPRATTWSRRRRPALDSFIASGGHVLLFIQVKQRRYGAAAHPRTASCPQDGASRDLTAGGLAAGTSGGGVLSPGRPDRGLRAADRAVPAGARRAGGQGGPARRRAARAPPPARAGPDGRRSARTGTRRGTPPAAPPTPPGT